MSQTLETAVRLALDLARDGVARREAIEEASRRTAVSEAEIGRNLLAAVAKDLIEDARRGGDELPTLRARARAAAALGVTEAAVTREIDRELGAPKPADLSAPLDLRLERAGREAARAEAQGVARGAALSAAAEKWDLAEELLRARLYARRRGAREGLGAHSDGRGLACDECGEALVRCKGPFGSYYMCRGGHRAKTRRTPTETPCPDCGRPLDIVTAPTGAFLGCPGFPTCKARRPLPPELRESAGVACPSCQTPMVLGNGPGGAFLECPAGSCRRRMPLPGEGPYRSNPRAPVDCPECGAAMAVVEGRRGQYFACTRAPWCEGRAPSPGRLLCPECGGEADLVVAREASVLVCQSKVRCPDDARRMRRTSEVRHRVYRCSEPSCGRRVTLGASVPQAAAIDHFFAVDYHAARGRVAAARRVEYRTVCADCGGRKVSFESHAGEYFWACAEPACRARVPAETPGARAPWACPDCGAPTRLREGSFGPFAGCARFPDCRGSVAFDPPHRTQATGRRDLAGHREARTAGSTPARGRTTHGQH